jgi:hypothetical protein
MMEEKPLHTFFWLWLPIIVILLQIPLELMLPANILASLHSEEGPHEVVEFIVLIFALGTALSTLWHINWKNQKWLSAWIVLAAVCCFYVAGEEISWGQHFIKWSTPNFWAHVNDQNETNLHNTSSWLDQKPRLILLIGIAVGGLIMPLLRHYKPALLPKKFEIIYPPTQLVVTSLFVVGIQILDSIDSVLDGIKFFERASEVEELYMFYFVLLYLVILRRRVLQD